MNRDLLLGPTGGSTFLWGREAGFLLPDQRYEEPIDGCAWQPTRTLRSGCAEQEQRQRGLPSTIHRSKPRMRLPRVRTLSA